MPTPGAETALTTNVLSQDAINEALQKAGLAEPEATGGVNRVTMNGFMFTFDDGNVATSNPKTGTPAFRARLLDAPTEYQAAWLTEPLAAAIGRPQDAKRFCKSHFDTPNEARKRSESGADCTACPIGPFIPRDQIPVEADGRKCQWKADVHFQLVDDDGAISDPTVHTLTISTTSVIEFKGTAKSPVKGSASELNTIQKLARLGAAKDPENPTAGMSAALLALRLGGVICDVSALSMSSDDKSRSWTVASFNPVDVLDIEETPAMPAIEAGEDTSLPF